MRPIGLPLLAVGLLLAACGRPDANVVIVTLDTTRYDRLGLNGDPEARTPVLDALARRGLVFDQHYAPTGLTLPSHTTILTGLEPRVHGVHNNGKFRVPEEAETLAEVLAGRGYRTAAFVSAFVLDHRYRLDQGFETYSDQVEPDREPLSMMVPQRPGAQVTDEALAWLGELPDDAPFFLWAHYYDPHFPRTVTPPFDEIRDPYRAEIAYTDAQVGRLLAGVANAARERPTLLVITADHGESLGEHGEATHGIVAYDSTLHVPMILAGPGVPAGERTDVFTHHADIVPTVLARLRIDPPPGLRGTDMVRAARRGERGEAAVAAFQSLGPSVDLGWAELEGIRTPRWKYTARPAPAELYDVRADPTERHDLATEAPDVVAQLEEEYRRYVETSRPVSDDTVGTLTPEEQEQLAALGYVEAPAQFEESERPDPRRFVGVHSWVNAARTLASRGRYAEAIDALETLRESVSVRPLVLRSLAPIYREAGRWDDAARAYRDYIELTGAEEAKFGLAEVLLRAGRAEEALEAIAQAAPSPRAVWLRAAALADLGRFDEARAAIEKGLRGRRALHQRAQLVLRVAPHPDGERELRALLAEAPDDARLKSHLGFYLALWGDPAQQEEALALLREAAEAAPDDAMVQSNLGWAAFRLGHAEEAVRALDAALALDERRTLDRARLGFALASLGENERAREALRAALAQQPRAGWAGEARRLLGRLEATAAAEAAP